MDEIEDDEPLCWTCKHGKWDHLNGSGACGQCSLGCPAYAVMTSSGVTAVISTGLNFRPASRAAELVRQYQTRTGPLTGDPFDPDLWMHAAAELLNGGPL